MPSTSVVFRFIEDTHEFEIIRHEVSSTAFGAVRIGLSRLIEIFGEEEGMQTAVDPVRAQLLYWLTAPIDFRSCDTEFLAQYGTAASMRRQWGESAGTALAQCNSAIEALQQEESPLREVVRLVLAEQVNARRRVRVHCHRRSRPLFESLFEFDASLKSTIGFVHTPRDYELAEPVDVLVHVGPLRRGGFAALPPAALNAPRQRTIMQIVWAGLRDEPGFGSDPVEQRLEQIAGRVTGTGSVRTADTVATPKLRWVPKMVLHGSATDRFAEGALRDELEVFGQRRPAPDLRPALMVHFADGMATLITPGAEVLVWRAQDAMWRANRIAAEAICESNYLIRADIGDVDFGGVLTRDGQYSVQWKERLNEEARSSMTRLTACLRRAGLELEHLRHRIEHWRQPATTVIHAPQQAEHFRILIGGLGIEDDYETYPHPAGIPWWRLAWREIQRSRGQAIQAGVQAQAIVDEELLEILDGMPTPEGLEKGTTMFTVALPSGQSLSGQVACRRVEAVDHGFRVPESVLHALITPHEAYQWRD